MSLTALVQTTANGFYINGQLVLESLEARAETLECPKAGLCFIFGLGGHLAARELECEICKSAEKKREKEKGFLDNPKALGNNSKVFEKSDEIRERKKLIIQGLRDPKSTIKSATNPKYGIIGLIYNPNLTVSLFSGCAHSLDACCGQRATATAAGTLWISLYGFPIARMIQTKHAGKREPGRSIFCTL
ncbi:hypothetical protein Ddc_15176 [Ditylenchus destructor]|nr:hypothetical protein Ddc_15176 [Ditylenchus destructor]